MSFISTNQTTYNSVTVRARGVYPPTAITQTSPPLPSPFLPSPFPPSPSLPEGLGAEPPVVGVRGCYPGKMEIEIGFGAFWRIYKNGSYPLFHFL